MCRGPSVSGTKGWQKANGFSEFQANNSLTSSAARSDRTPQASSISVKQKAPHTDGERKSRDIETHIYYSDMATDPVTYAQRGLSVKPSEQPDGNSLTLTAAETEPTGRSQLKEPSTVRPKGLRPSRRVKLSFAIQSGVWRAELWLNALQIKEMSCATWLYHGQFRCTNTRSCQRWKALNPRAGIWSGKTAKTWRSSLLEAPSSHLHPPWSSTKMTNAWEVMEGITARTKSGEKQVWVWTST